MLTDCHAHVYHSTEVIPGARYRPAAPAPLSDWLALRAASGVGGGVLVQPSFFGTDNRQMLDLLATLDPARVRGVAVVDLSAGSGMLEDLHRAGVRGLRWNCVQGAALPDPAERGVADFLGRIAEAGLHLELHLEEGRLCDYLPVLLPRVPRLVVDHFGLPRGARPVWQQAIPAGQEGRVFVKLSAPYRGGAAPDPGAAVAALAERIPADHMVWGSDWPWTRHEAGRDYAALATQAAGWTEMGADIAAGARTLYGL